MSDFLDRISKLSPQRLALLAVQLNANLEQLKQQAAEPLAVIGLGCRLPGGVIDAASFWRVLAGARDVISEVPADRFDVDAYYDPDPDAPAKMCTRWGGFVDGVDQFDPEFFGISPREAAGMDPQQRLMLEVAWEALENAGQSPESLAGSRAGVFAGLCNSDYYTIRLAAGPGSMDAYVATGNAHSVASGRISYALGLQGPSVTVDTACSSSLVAVHLACQSLRARECNLALAGGANLILLPDTTITLSKSHMMSPVGRCKAFDASADGFVRSEGCGLLVLKRLSDARRDGDQVLAVIRGSACNQDGASSGLTAPNGPSQVAVIRDALANAGLKPGDIDYIEAHGTGTSLGDPIEARALAEVFAPDRAANQPLRVGSVKSNMGHAESAAGIAGLIKAVLSLQHGQIPPSLHLQKLNPHIDWSGLPLEVPTAPTDWIRPPGQRAVGVSSFGFSGTNAHIILSDVAEETVASSDGNGAGAARPRLLPLSARTAPALTALAQQYADTLSQTVTPDYAAVCHSAGAGRSHFEHRLSVGATSIAEAREALAAHARGESHARARQGWTGNAPVPGVVFLFTGQGSQYANMGLELFEKEPVFRRELERCAEILQPLLDRPLLELLRAEPGVLDQTQYTQPALFALEYSLAAIWRSWGIEPAAVLGHSVGEYVAACVAGIFSLEDGLRLIAERGRLMATLPMGGTMAAVFADEAHVADAIGTATAQVAIACLNGPANVVVSGERTAVQVVLDRLTKEGVKNQPLVVSHAFHSPLMDSILAPFERVAQSIQYASPQIAIISNVTGALAEPELMTNAGYWRRHVRQAVRFTDSIRAARASGQSIFLEIGPQPVLTGLARQTATESDVTWAASLGHGRSELDTLLDGAATLYTRGVNFQWAAFSSEKPPSRVALPTYPFQRSRYWLEPVKDARRTARPVNAHPLVGERLDSPAIAGAVYDLEFGPDRPSFLNDHRIFGRLIMPSPAYIEMALAGLSAIGGPASAPVTPCEVVDLMVREPLFLPETGSCRIQLLLDEATEAGTTFRVCSREMDVPQSSPWRTHATGRVRAGEAIAGNAATAWPRREVMQRCPKEANAREYYDSLIALGLEFGDRFRGITRIWRGQNEAVGEMQLPTALARETGPYRIHPALLDACFHLLGAAFAADETSNAYLLIGIERFTLRRPPPNRFWNHTVLRPTKDARTEAFTGDVRLYDDDGQLLAEISGLQLRRATGEALARAGGGGGPDGWFHELQWRSVATAASAPAPRLADFVPAPATLAAIVEPELRALAAHEHATVYDEMMPALESLSAQFILRAFARLQWSPRTNDRITVDALAQQLAVVPAHRRLFARLLAILAEDGWLRRDGEAWVVLKPWTAPTADLQAASHALRGQYPTTQAEVTLTARCANRLDEVLRGTCDPLQLLFPNGDFDVADELYRTSPFARTMNGGARHALLQVLQATPAGHTLRILEIGAGTGGTSAALIPHLPRARTHYTYTDVSPLFVDRAKEEFGEHDSAEYAILDIEKSPATQGFAGRTFDVIVAANVLHATRDLRETVKYAVSLLAPGGLLLLLEGTSPRRWVDLTFGLSGGWWRFSDTDLRPDYALLAGSKWRQILAELGLDSVHLSASADANATLAHQALLLARKPVVAPKDGKLAADAGYWIILRDADGVADATADALRATGEAAVLVSRGNEFVSQDANAVTLNPSERADFTRLLAETAAAHRGPLLGLLNLWPLDESITAEWSVGDWSSSQARVAAGVLHAAQAFLSADSTAEPAARRPRFWLATRGAQTTRDAETEAGHPTQAIAWGLGRTLSLEHPTRFGAVIDLDPDAAVPHMAAAILGELHGDGHEDAVAFRNGQRLEPRVVQTKEPPAAHQLTLDKDASYLITGGLGGLGLPAARRLAQRGAGCIVLVSRRKFPTRDRWASMSEEDADHATISTILEIEKSGARVVVARGDVADETQMTSLFARFGNELPPLRGVLHAAVAMTSCPLTTLDLASFGAMCRAKTEGAWVLHRLTREINLDFLVFYSSTTALWGVAGLGHYAAANQMLDQLAAWCRAHGQPALAINWGTWREMRAANEEDKQAFAQSGLRPMETDRALDAMERLLGAGSSAAIVAAVDWSALRAVYEVRRPRPIFDELGVTARAQSAPGATASQPTREVEILGRLRDASPKRRRDLLIAHLRALAGAVLGFDARREIPLDQGLFDMGMDSLMSVELKGRLERSLGVPLPSTLTFNYPSIGALAEFLDEELSPSNTSDSTEAQIYSRPPPLASSIDETETELTKETIEERLAEKLRNLGFE